MTELPLLLLALAGGTLAWRQKQHLIRYLAIFALFQFVIYSTIPYKTPWCILSCLYLAIAPAGYAVATAWRRNQAWRIAILSILAIVAFDNHRQTTLAADRMAADRRNPWVYAHPVTDAKSLAKNTVETAKINDATIVVVCSDPWPLPWYFRSVKTVGYWEMPPTGSQIPTGPILWLVDTRHEALIERLAGENYPAINGLRHDTLISTINQKSHRD
jgi:hypothetical protein